MNRYMAALATVVFAMFLFLISEPQLLSASIESLEPVDRARVIANFDAIGQCIGQDFNFCVGSFVKLRNGSIFKTSLCEKACSEYEMGMRRLIGSSFDEQFLNRIETIVLPIDSRSDAFKAQYENQISIREISIRK